MKSSNVFFAACIAMGAFLLSPSVAVASGSDERPPIEPPSAQEIDTEPQLGEVASDESGCDLDADGNGFCIESGVPMDPEELQAQREEAHERGGEALRGSLDSPPLVEVPAACLATLNQWVYNSREDQCIFYTGTVSYVANNALAGTAYFYQGIYNYTSASLLYSVVQTELEVTNVVGVFPVSLELVVRCVLYCETPGGVEATYDVGYPVIGALYQTSWYIDTPGWYESSPSPLPAIRPHMATGAQWTHPNNSIGNVVKSHKVQCDGVIVGKAPGCVVYMYTPTHHVLTSTPTVQNHVQAAIASGLPSLLTRTQNQTVVDLNRLTSCGSPPAVLLKSCDEYPFASTYEGAAQQVANGGVARTFPSCSFSDPASTGPIGYSHCMVLETENSLAGSHLGGFYSINRVIEGSKFFVSVL